MQFFTATRQIGRGANLWDDSKRKFGAQLAHNH